MAEATMSLPNILLEIVGILIVLFGLREVFRDIFHPTRSGTLSEFVGQASSFLMRKTRLRPAIGALSLVITIACWIATLAFGFALIYWGLAPDQLMVPSDAGPHHAAHQFLRCVYFSLGAFDTFQTFDVTPGTNWLRLVITIEGLTGISMITASVSWTVLLYPALARSRQFARRVSVLVEAEQKSGLCIVPELGVPLLLELAQAVLQYRIDITLFPVLLNFYTSEPESTIAHVLPQVLRFAREAVDSKETAVRLGGVQLEIALHSLGAVISERVSQRGQQPIENVFSAFKQREA
jgi:hypothetical protein